VNLRVPQKVIHFEYMTAYNLLKKDSVIRSFNCPFDFLSPMDEEFSVSLGHFKSRANTEFYETAVDRSLIHLTLHEICKSG
jgi:hypothetical protein